MICKACPIKSDYRDDHLERLLLPVIVRAVETAKPKPVLKDETSSEIIRRLEYDLTNPVNSIDELRSSAIIARSICFERITRDFIRRYPDATLVNLGCGLDTTYERINNRTIHWYDIDSEYVIEIRKLFLSETSNRRFLTYSFIEGNWFKEIINKDHVLFIAHEPFYHYDEEKVKKCLKKLSDLFPLSELAFDALSPTGARIANRLYVKTGGETIVKWSIKNIKEILSWDMHFRLIGKKVIFRRGELHLAFWDRITVKVSNVFCMWYVLHLRILPDYRHLSV